jgi:hypothetical protein
MKTEGNCGAGADTPTVHEPRKAERHNKTPEEPAWHHAPKRPRATSIGAQTDADH